MKAQNRGKLECFLHGRSGPTRERAGVDQSAKLNYGSSAHTFVLWTCITTEVWSSGTGPLNQVCESDFEWRSECQMTESDPNCERCVQTK